MVYNNNCNNNNNNKASLRRVLTMRSTYLDNAFFVGLLVEVAKYQSISMSVNDCKLSLLTDELILEGIVVCKKDLTELKLTTLPILCNIGLDQVKYIKFWFYDRNDRRVGTDRYLSLHEVVVSYLLGKELVVGYPFVFQRKSQSDHEILIPPELRV